VFEALADHGITAADTHLAYLQAVGGEADREGEEARRAGAEAARAGLLEAGREGGRGEGGPIRAAGATAGEGAEGARPRPAALGIERANVDADRRGRRFKNRRLWRLGGLEPRPDAPVFWPERWGAASGGGGAGGGVGGGAAGVAGGGRKRTGSGGGGGGARKKSDKKGHHHHHHRKRTGGADGGKAGAQEGAQEGAQQKEAAPSGNLVRMAVDDGPASAAGGGGGAFPAHPAGAALLLSGGTNQCLPVLQQGHLWKRGRLRRSWKERWFVLDADGLWYYKSRKVTPACHSSACALLVPLLQFGLTYLPTCLPADRPTDRPTYLPTYLPAYTRTARVRTWTRPRTRPTA
jgi:hypothetical protein